MVSRLPVNTTTLPAISLSPAVSGVASSSIVSSPASSSSVARLRGSMKNSASSSAIAGPMPMMLPSVLRSSEPMVVAASIWVRQWVKLP